MADTVHVAVAANFRATETRLAQRFRATTGHRVVASTGSTGQLYAQIVHGAPFEVFLAADTLRPARLVESGHALRGSTFTYALGSLVLCSTTEIDSGDGAEMLRSGRFRRLAIAHPETAPYGRAALETLRRLGLEDAMAGRLVRGENVTQAMHFVTSGAADLGLVARALVSRVPATRIWQVPGDLHGPIRQDAVLLSTAAVRPAARDYLDFLVSAEGRALIASAGYDLPPPATRPERRP